LRLLASPRIWGPVLGIVAVLALVFYAYLGAVVSSEENLEDLPIALVNKDRGGDLARRSRLAASNAVGEIPFGSPVGAGDPRLQASRMPYG
jgi:hypothetical protein